MQIKHSKPQVSQKDCDELFKQVQSGMHASGDKTKQFEKEFSKFTKIKNAKALSSGCAALHIALLALGIKKDDEIIIPSYVCQSLMNAVNYVGAKPILIDINSNFTKKGYNISAETIKPAITKKTKAIIIPHMFGTPAEINEIKKFNIPIIEDCAHSIGATHNNVPLGNFGDLAIFSFYATKMMSTGNGGMIATNSNELFQKINELTKNNRTEIYKIAYNYDLSDIQSSLGISQLENLNNFIERRKQIAQKYNEAFKNTNLELPPNNRESFNFRYIIKTENSIQLEQLKNYLRYKNINAEKPVFKPLHQYLNLPKEKFPNTEEAHNTTLSIPIYPALTDNEVERVINGVLSFFDKGL